MGLPLAEPVEEEELDPVGEQLALAEPLSVLVPELQPVADPVSEDEALLDDVPLLDTVAVGLPLAELVEEEELDPVGKLLALAELLPVLVPELQPVADPGGEDEVALADSVALPDGVLVADAAAVAGAVALAKGELLEVALPEPLAVALPVAAPLREKVPSAVAEGVQEGSAEEPAAQDGVHTQGVQVAMEDAPSAGEKVPAGHGTGLVEERGQ